MDRGCVMAHVGRAVSVVLLFGMISSILVPAGESRAATRRGSDIQIYSLQILINQAYQMALEGSALVMIDRMGKGGLFGGLMDQRGWKMIEQSRQIIKDTLEGEEMKTLIEEGYGDSPLLAAVRENAGVMQEGIEAVRAYLSVSLPEPRLSQMHSLFILLNHGIKMATDGANLIMLGRSGSADASRETLQKHGRTMMQDGRVFVIRLADHETMKALHASGITPERDAAMRSLHTAMDTALKIIDRLARM